MTYNPNHSLLAVNCPRCKKIGTQKIERRNGKRYMKVIHKDSTCDLGRVRSTEEVMKDWGF